MLRRTWGRCRWVRLLKIRENIGADLRGGDWRAEIQTLSLVAVDLVEKGRLRGGFVRSGVAA